MNIVISSGHGKYVSGANSYLIEVDEARRVVDRVAELLNRGGVDTFVFHDDVSHSQSENLDRIVDYHNAQERDLDVSVHFNSGGGSGTEVLYVTQDDLSNELSARIASVAAWPDRGGKYRGDLAFLNGTEEPAILIEVCFVDSANDADKYHDNFERICLAIADVIGDVEFRPPGQLPWEGGQAHFRGPCSWFGGPNDQGVSPSEGLAFIYDYDQAPHLFLPEQPPGTTGLARRLNPGVFYVACRWDYSVTSKEMLARSSVQALVRAGNLEFLAWPADWGPHEDTERAVDVSPALMDALGIDTDQVVEVLYPAVWTGS